MSTLPHAGSFLNCLHPFKLIFSTITYLVVSERVRSRLPLPSPSSPTVSQRSRSRNRRNSREDVQRDKRSRSRSKRRSRDRSRSPLRRRSRSPDRVPERVSVIFNFHVGHKSLHFEKFFGLGRLERSVRPRSRRAWLGVQALAAGDPLHMTLNTVVHVIVFGPEFATFCPRLRDAVIPTQIRRLGPVRLSGVTPVTVIAGRHLLLVTRMSPYSFVRNSFSRFQPMVY